MSQVCGVAEHTSGIGNTIKALVSAMHRHPNNFYTNSETLHNLFTGVPLINDLGNFKDFELYNTWIFSLTEDEREQIANLRLITTSEIPYPVIDLQYEKIPSAFVQKFTQYFKRLENELLNPEISNEIKNILISQKALNSNIISLHIRTWFDDSWRKNNWFNYINFKTVIEEHLKDNNDKIYLACDDLNIKNLVIQEYGNRILTLPNNIFGGDITHSTGSLAAAKAALTEILLLGSNPTIIGTKFSSFTECAWWFAKSKYNSVKIKIV